MQKNEIIKTSRTGHGELRSRKHKISTQSSAESHNSKDSEIDEDSEEELAAPASAESSDSLSSDEDNDDDDDDDSEDEIPAVIFNHPLVDDLLDRFMRAQLQTDINVNNSNNDKNAGKK